MNFIKNIEKLATMTAIKPPGRYGAISMMQCGKVKALKRKPPGDGGYINGGFFVLSNTIFEKLTDENLSWESKPLIDLVESKQLMAFKHEGFWCAMDTLREKTYFINYGLMKSSVEDMVMKSSSFR